LSKVASNGGERSERDGARSRSSSENGPATGEKGAARRQAISEERVWLARAQAGDHEAFRCLVESYNGRAFRLALRVLRDPEEARDAVQDAFLKLYRQLRRFEGRSSFYTWFYRLVLNVCLDRKRRDRSAREVVLNEGQEIVSEPVAASRNAPPAADALQELWHKELRERVAAAISELPEGARLVLLLREVEDLQYTEIAEVLGIPKGTVMSRLHYARKSLQKLLFEAGVLEGSEFLPETPESGTAKSARKSSDGEEQ